MNASLRLMCRWCPWSTPTWRHGDRRHGYDRLRRHIEEAHPDESTADAQPERNEEERVP